MLRRLLGWIRETLISLDQLAQVLIVGPFHVVGIATVAPSADETISSYVGRGQLRGRTWARVLAPPIDALFMLLGEGPGHCFRSIEHPHNP